mmetsp:Transcript_2703/g.4182  ORF Transcript_2703/g.4182 Transcript_2703/m.4182 type:complete len:242 (+) Transcript_2703:64-789(+)
MAAAVARARKVLILGAGGQLGKKVGEVFTAHNWHTIGADVALPRHVTQAIQFRTASLETQHEELHKALGSERNLDAVVNVAGGFAMGSASDCNVLANTVSMVNSSIYTSVLAAHIASTTLKPGGLIVLPGAAAAYNPTAWSLPYGTAKVAVHHLVRSLENAEDAGLPSGVKTIGIAPITLDTPQNREAMPDADTTTWATLEEVAEKLQAWCQDPSEVESGKVYVIEKKSGQVANFQPKVPL